MAPSYALAPSFMHTAQQDIHAIVNVTITTHLVCVLFDLAIPTSSFHFIVFVFVICIHVYQRWETITR